jgi:hypothetical protein
MWFSRPDRQAGTVNTGDVPVDEFVGRALANGAAELAATLPHLARADRRAERALDRWFTTWADQLRSYLDVVSSVLVPAATGRGVLDERWLDTIADDLALIDELVSHLGDAIGIVAMDLGDRDVWLERAATLAKQLALLVQSEVALHQRLAGSTRDDLTPDELRAVTDGTVRALGTWQARRIVPSLLRQLPPDERDAVLAAAPATTSWWWRVGRGQRMPAAPV